MMGDGEIQEGQIWEAAMSAPKFGLSNLCGILDYNDGQIDGPVARSCRSNRSPTNGEPSAGM